MILVRYDLQVFSDALRRLIKILSSIEDDIEIESMSNAIAPFVIVADEEKKEEIKKRLKAENYTIATHKNCIFVF